MSVLHQSLCASDADARLGQRSCPRLCKTDLTRNVSAGLGEGLVLLAYFHRLNDMF
jgi:hypothetical protein